jgi:ABC-2 type transport system permease protein
MNVRAMAAIATKDLAVVRRSKAVMLPLVIVPTILVLLLPAIAVFAPSFVNLPGAGDLGALLERMPETLQASLAPYTPEQRLVVLMLVYLFAPLYLIVPLMVASVIAADTFAGERERKTLEALLHTPTSDAELVLAKLASGFVPAVLVGWGAFLAYAVVVNASAWPVMGRIFFPTPMWWVLALLVGPGVAALGLGATVLVSARVATFQEAYQIGGVVVLPLVLLIVGQAAGVVFLSTTFVAVLGVVIWLLAGALLAFGLRTFRRGELLART